jgi:UDP-N-acetylglucosamine:LPS N-acetylglucosamine transferase
MRIFVTTSNHPLKNSTGNIIVKNFIKNLKENNSVFCIWFLYNQKKNGVSENLDEIIIDIHDYNDAIEVLKKIKPDCILANNNQYATIDHAFSLAAKFLKIPLIYNKIVDFTDTDEKEVSENKFKRIMKKIVVKNSETNQHILPFILYKNKFLFKTKNKMKINLCSNIKTQIEHIMFNFIGDPKKRFTNLADLNLINNEIWLKKFKESGIDEKKMVITGNPYWDKYFEIFKKRNLSKDPVIHNPIKILILTSPLFEHGFWSKKQRDIIIRKLIEILTKEEKFLIAFKIHPTSEHLKTYEEFTEKNSKNIKIYQKESLWDIADNYDIVISYGFSMIHTEIAIAGYRMVLCNFDQKFRLMPLVDLAIDSGFVKICNDLEELPIQIHDLVNKQIKFNEKFDNEIKKFLYKFDGNSGKRVSDAIQILLKNYKQK